MKKIAKIITATALLFAAQQSFAACAEPTPPALPDPATAVTPEMVKAKNAVKSYMSDADKYLGCKRLTDRQHNAMVDKMQTLAKDFNQVIKDYKQRQGS